MKRFKELLLIAGLSTLSLSGASALWRFPLERVSAQSSEDHVIYLNQGWSPEVREAYYHLSQGSTVMPYEAAAMTPPGLSNLHMSTWRTVQPCAPSNTLTRLH